MAYACPVCDTVEADAEHLANHLAVTASLHGDDHAAWLDEHAPDWPELSPPELGAAVTEHAEEREVEVSAQDAEASTHDHDRHGHTRPGTPDRAGDLAPDPETERILREAREMTARSDDDPEE